MTVYVESNFVVELARAQEQSTSCEALLALAESRAIRLALPAYALAEPNDTFRGTAKKREELFAAAQGPLHLVRRTPTFAKQASDVEDDLRTLLFEAQKQDWLQLHEVRTRLVAAAAVFPLTGSVVLAAQRAETEMGLKPQDALVYASVLNALRRSGGKPSLLLTRDTGFDDPDIRAVLNGLGCDVLGRYDHGLQRVEASLRGGATSA